MLDFYVESAAKQERLRNGPFSEVMEPLAMWLREQGLYNPGFQKEALL